MADILTCSLLAF